MEIQTFNGIQFFRNFSKYDISGSLGKTLLIEITPNWVSLTEHLEKGLTKKQKTKILQDYVDRRDMDPPWRVDDGILMQNPTLYKFPDDEQISLNRQKLFAIDTWTTKAKDYADEFVVFFNKYDLGNLTTNQHGSGISDTESTTQE